MLVVLRGWRIWPNCVFLLQGPSLPGPPVSVGLVGLGWVGTPLGVVLEGVKPQHPQRGDLRAQSLSLGECLFSFRVFQARLGFLERSEHWDPR